MVAVVGNIEAKDDLMHPLGPEENFNESMYFNFFDDEGGYGGFLRCGNRANEGYAEVTLCVFLPGGEVLFNYQRPRIENNNAMDAAGVRFEVLEPLVRHRTTYDEGALFLSDPTLMSDPGKAFRESPRKRVRIDVTHEAAGPVFGSKNDGREVTDPEKEFARAHYEQHMLTTGTLEIDGDTRDIHGTGLRDHSWGPRYWQALHSYRWLTCTFDDTFGLMVSEVWPDKHTPNQNGVVIRDGKLERIVKVHLESQYEADTLYHRSMTADVTLDSGEQLQVEGTVKGFIPLRNRRAGLETHIGEAMTEYRCAGKRALGISEYLDQVK